MRRLKAERGLNNIKPGVNDTADALFAAIKASHFEVSPSMLFAIAYIREGEPFVLRERASGAAAAARRLAQAKEEEKLQNSLRATGDAAPATLRIASRRGVQDVTNLIWKLDLALQDEAKYDSLLDSYNTERKPIGARVECASLRNLRSHGLVMNAALSLKHRQLARAELGRTQALLRPHTTKGLAGPR
ncbi:uncharacterized protein B0H18DRAFT_1119834 [Fomitopsis serialis]|uniref:uncharacterized protein n=1 Tax=Fomitopsis serialis TaxID=139415 RepID=UPI0020084835|nr:uncharacterized protein B0H18DRAFT_1119834 [Neoantrodia serialis]KAH9924490.1 hypothetical protein B0H18DRAFT_1119834 [Neoantrodia serialis]